MKNDWRMYLNDTLGQNLPNKEVILVHQHSNYYCTLVMQRIEFIQKKQTFMLHFAVLGHITLMLLS